MSDASLPQRPAAQEPLDLSTKLAYGAGDLGPAITANILSFFLLIFFTNVAGMNAGLAGTVLLISKIWDAVNDPIIGVLSDRTQSARWGRRYPWMLYGAIPFGITFFLQWLVPRFSDNAATNQWGLFAYYILIAILFNSFYTIVNLPYTALTPELTQDYNERTSLNSFRFAFSIGGSILSLLLALVIFQIVPDAGQQYLWLGGISAVLSTVPLYWCVFGTRARAAAVATAPTGDTTQTNRNQMSAAFRQAWRVTLAFLRRWIIPVLAVYTAVQLITRLLAVSGMLPTLLQTILLSVINPLWFVVGLLLVLVIRFLLAFTNRPFVFVIGIYFCSWLAVQVTAAILPFFVVNCMGLASQDFTLIALAVQGTALLMLFFWSAVSARIGKKAVYFMGMVLWILAQAGLFFLKPEQAGLVYPLAIMAGIGVSTAYLIPWSMIPDVIELDELNTGERREGIFYSLMVLLQKVGLAIGLFVVGQALDLAGFIESVPGQPPPVQPESALTAIRVAIGPMPTLALLAGLVLAYFYPISREVHAEILLKLEEKRRQENSKRPKNGEP
jgi:glycoside/pentoside/hexuronide:cation symporter, GPH family